ncbi:MAG: diguanylate cyclase [Spirochaetia bacterium]|nr:diguanylate cyclase [Spirochaetia bacterium]
MKTEQILIVEDEGLIAKEIEARLKTLGYQITGIMQNGEDVLEHIPKYKPDLILMDIQIKGNMDGIEIAQKIKKLYQIPVIYLTAFADEKTLERAKKTNPYGYIVKPFDETDLKIRIDMALYKHSIEKQNKELMNEANSVLIKNLQTDSLTGIANRRKFDLRIKTEWENSILTKSYISIFLIDVDYFKRYNDTYGHISGDDCLVLIAKTIESCVSRKRDLAARYGGEEFSVILPETDNKRAIILAERIRKEVENLRINHRKSDASIYVTISIGICSIRPTSSSKYKNFFKKADEALYLAKKDGRNRVVSLIYEKNNDKKSKSLVSKN